MPRRPDVLCADCFKPIWRGTGSLPDGEAMCHACRRRRAGRRPDERAVDIPRWKRELRFCENPECGQAYEPTRRNQRYCHPDHRPHSHGAPKLDPKARALNYGGRHKRLRAQVSQLVDAGDAYCTEVVCLEPDRWIEPGTEWHLAHDRAAGPGQYLGPAHARCNTSEGARWGNQRRGPEQREPEPERGITL